MLKYIHWKAVKKPQIYRSAKGLRVAVQQQTMECGVMAIANAYHAICGDDLAKVSFAEVDSMRNHLSRYDDSYRLFC